MPKRYGKTGGGFLRDRRGAAAVEFGLVALPLFLLIFGAVEFGLALWTQNTLQYAVEQAARCAVVNSSLCGTPSQIQAYALSKAYGLKNVTASAFAATNASCGWKVSASVPFAPLSLISRRLTLQASSCHPT